VLHEDRRARFVRMHGGAAIIRHSGDGEAVAVPLEALSVPPVTSHDSAPRASAGAAFCHVGPGPIRVRRLSRAEVRWLPRHPFPRRPIPLP
jgi:hypothetical protein